MMGRAEVDERNYSEFVSDLQSSLETAYRDVRESLRAAQRRQKDCYDKGVKHMVFQTGDLVLRYTLQLKPDEANKFHRQWEGPFEVVESVTDVTYLVKKVRGRSRRSQVVHFNNLRLYQKRQEAQLGEPVAGGSVDAPQGGSEESGRAAPAGGEVEPVESDTVDGGTEDEVIGVEAAEEFFNELADVQDESGYRSCLADTASVGEFEQGGGCDQVVQMPDTEEGKMSEDVQNDNASVEENREDAHKVEEEQPVGQSPRPVRVRRPPDRYGEWILNSLQQISDRLKTSQERRRSGYRNQNCCRRLEHCGDSETVFFSFSEINI